MLQLEALLLGGEELWVSDWLISRVLDFLLSWGFSVFLSSVVVRVSIWSFVAEKGGVFVPAWWALVLGLDCWGFGFFHFWGFWCL